MLQGFGQPDRHFDAAFFGEFGRVVDEVLQNAFDLLPIRGHHGQVGRVAPVDLDGLGQGESIGSLDLVQQIAQREAARLDAHFVGFDAGRVQNTGDHPQQVAGAADELVEGFVLLGIGLAEHPLPDEAGVADDDVQRRAELVRHHAQEFVFDFVRPLQLLDFLPELAVQLAVFQGDGDLVRHRFQELDLPRGQTARRGPGAGQGAQILELAPDGEDGEKVIAGLSGDFAPAELPVEAVGRDVFEDQRLAGLGHFADDALPPAERLDRGETVRVDLEAGPQMELVGMAVVDMDLRRVEPEDLADLVDRRLQHPVDVERLAGGGRHRVETRKHPVGLLQLSFAEPGVLVELGIVNGDGRLARQGGEKFDLLAGEFVLFLGVEAEHPQSLVLDDQGNAHVGSQPVLAVKLDIEHPRVLSNVGDDQRGLGFHHDVGDAAPGLPLLEFPFLFIEVAAGHGLQVAALLVEKPDGGGGVGKR